MEDEHNTCLNDRDTKLTKILVSVKLQFSLAVQIKINNNNNNNTNNFYCFVTKGFVGKYHTCDFPFTI